MTIKWVSSYSIMAQTKYETDGSRYGKKKEYYQIG